MGSEDLMMGAQSKSLDHILLTNNLKELTRRPGIRQENWVKNRHPHPHKNLSGLAKVLFQLLPDFFQGLSGLIIKAWFGKVFINL
jgi:hypothetical protein